MTASSLFKYFNESGGVDSEHRGNLHWPGTAAGIPLRADTPPLLRGEEFEDRIKHTADFHSRLFQLWDDGDKQAFDAVMNKIHLGWYREVRRYDRWSEQHTGMIVWLEWLQIYGEYTGGDTTTVIR